MRRIRGVLLDVDGTLVDSNDAHAHSWVEAFAEQGIQVPFAPVRRASAWAATSSWSRFPASARTPRKGSASASGTAKSSWSGCLPSLRPTPGATELLHRLRDDELKLTVASSAKKDELKGLLKVCGADEVIAGAASSDDADRSKPDPDIVRAALKEIALPPKEVVMLGDTPYDVESAGRAGVGVIAFRCGGWDDTDLRGAVAVYDDPGNLLVHYDSSLFAKGV